MDAKRTPRPIRSFDKRYDIGEIGFYGGIQFLFELK